MTAPLFQVEVLRRVRTEHTEDHGVFPLRELRVLRAKSSFEKFPGSKAEAHKPFTGRSGWRDGEKIQGCRCLSPFSLLFHHLDLILAVNSLHFFRASITPSAPALF